MVNTILVLKVLKDKTEEISMMNTYTKSPGVLKVKDGKKYVSFTLTNSSWLQSLNLKRIIHLLMQVY